MRASAQSQTVADRCSGGHAGVEEVQPDSDPADRGTVPRSRNRHRARASAEGVHQQSLGSTSVHRSSRPARARPDLSRRDRLRLSVVPARIRLAGRRDHRQFTGGCDRNRTNDRQPENSGHCRAQFHRSGAIRSRPLQSRRDSRLARLGERSIRRRFRRPARPAQGRGPARRGRCEAASSGEGMELLSGGRRSATPRSRRAHSPARARRDRHAGRSARESGGPAAGFRRGRGSQSSRGVRHRGPGGDADAGPGCRVARGWVA